MAEHKKTQEKVADELKALRQQVLELEIQLIEAQQSENELRFSTGQKQVEVALQQERAQKYLDVAEVIMICIDVNEQIELINQKGCEVLGYTEKELLNNNWFDFCLPPQHREEIRAYFHQLMQGEIQNVFQYENTILTKLGEERIIEWHNTLLEEDGNIVGTLSSGQDITELKQAEIATLENEHLKTQFQKEQEHTAFIGRIILALSYDMRTPLAVISMSGDILNRHFDKLTEEKRQEKLAMIAYQTQFALELLDNTVKMVQSNLHKFRPTLVNLASLCQISSDEIYLAQNSTYQLRFNNIGKIGTVVIDETLVSRILLNLLSNAMKYSQENGEILLELDSQDDWIILRVIDHGIGIGSDDLPYIFDLLYRASNVKDILGVGLGLSIVKDCVERHQGSITVQSDIEKGSTFTVKLPYIE